MQISELIPHRTLNGMAIILLVGMVAFFVNKPDSDLEERVSDLEERVAILEGTTTDAGTVENNEERWKDVENWRQLRQGMSQEKVEELLGRPNRISGGPVTRWSYSTSGNVAFMNGQVSSWNEPRLTR
ncbi:MAG: outer membrane protein assembly factor BamE [Balneolaceae bacterium]|nr:outer membrane protein assembly factor BamE [Balneolaceae bacterium]